MGLKWEIYTHNRYVTFTDGTAYFPGAGPPGGVLVLTNQQDSTLTYQHQNTFRFIPIFETHASYQKVYRRRASFPQPNFIKLNMCCCFFIQISDCLPFMESDNVQVESWRMWHVLTSFSIGTHYYRYGLNKWKVQLICTVEISKLYMIWCQSVCLGLWNLRCAVCTTAKVQSYVVHQQPALYTTDLHCAPWWKVGVTPNLFAFFAGIYGTYWKQTLFVWTQSIVIWWFTMYIQIKVHNVVLYRRTLWWCTM